MHCFGAELGHGALHRARPDVFFTGPDGSLRSNRVFCQLAGHYAFDMFIGSTLQIDARRPTRSTVTDGRLSGFGGAPNMGHDPHGRRHASAAWLEPRARRGRQPPGPQAGGADGRRPSGPVAPDLRRDARRRGRAASRPACRCRR